MAIVPTQLFSLNDIITYTFVTRYSVGAASDLIRAVMADMNALGRIIRRDFPNYNSMMALAREQ